MKHIHKRFTVEQVKILLSAYLKKRLSSEEIKNELGIGKTRFFALLKRYKQNPAVFSFIYHRHTPTKLTFEEEYAMRDRCYLCLITPG